MEQTSDIIIIWYLEYFDFDCGIVEEFLNSSGVTWKLNTYINQILNVDGGITLKKVKKIRHSKSKVRRRLIAIYYISRVIEESVFVTKNIVVPAALLLWADNMFLRIAIIVFGVVAAFYDRRKKHWVTNNWSWVFHTSYKVWNTSTVFG